jgi:hypothetical protein
MVQPNHPPTLKKGELEGDFPPSPYIGIDIKWYNDIKNRSIYECLLKRGEECLKIRIAGLKMKK